MQRSRNNEEGYGRIEEQVTRRGLWIVLSFLILNCFVTDFHSWYTNNGIRTGQDLIPSYMSHFVKIHGHDVTETRNSKQRFLTILTDTVNEDMDPPPNNNGDSNDIDPHNKICRNYLKSFLEGTTDTNDECQGLQNAYSAADCQEDIIRRTLQNVHEDTNDSTNDDEKSKSDDVPAIDDFFQEFQCCQVISHYYSSRCLYHQQFASLSLLGTVVVLILCSLVKVLIKEFRLHWLPEAGGCILVGATVGAILTTQMPHFVDLGSFNGDLFLYIMLPAIIFHASLSIDKRQLWLLLFPILMFAVLGTILSAIISGFAVHYLTKALSITTTIPILDCMIFGSLISSIDPVATLSILQSLGVSNTNMLYVVVFGESILNDGVSIAMFESLVMHLDGTNKSLDHDLILSSAKHFCKVSTISITIGLFVGIFCTMYFWALKGRHGPVAEVATFFCFALVAYYSADGLGASGIVSIMMSGLFMDIFVRGKQLSESDAGHSLLQQDPDHSMNVSAINAATAAEREGLNTPTPSFTIPSFTDFRVMFSGVGHISNKAKVHVGFVADVLANLMETAIFAYLGLFLFSNKKWDDIPLTAIGITSCITSRIVMIGIISLLVNMGTALQEIFSRIFGFSDSSHPIPLDENQTTTYIDRNMQVVLLFSGVRGAVSLALAENIPLYDAVTKHGSQYKSALKAMTSASIIFTVFFFGASTFYTLKRQQQSINRRRDEEVDDLTLTSRRSGANALMTSLLDSHSLELRDEERDTPPWVNPAQV